MPKLTGTITITVNKATPTGAPEYTGHHRQRQDPGGRGSDGGGRHLQRPGHCPVGGRRRQRDGCLHRGQGQHRLQLEVRAGGRGEL
ncbi:MAG: hypothetical protein V8S34_01330 [Lawsonibacter sp.]